ncbi:hypothetical protein TanjilG_13840 [Lupinus angustifolius]|uniref:Uncharacterized protein n=1 Tax=Lupinus angustifolius TaxID=3871 RepID=A0A394DGG3_LUPAN|nr:hypothetical protein TanjilG_13840 [Lupinus angustifolius]
MMIPFEVVSMMRESNLDGDEVLTQMKFYISMFTMGQQLMEECLFWLEDALHRHL